MYLVIEKNKRDFSHIDEIIREGNYHRFDSLPDARKRGRFLLRTNPTGFVIIIEPKVDKKITGSDYVGVMEWTDGREYYPHDEKLAKLHTGYAYTGLGDRISGFVGADGKIKITFNEVNRKTRDYLDKKR